MQYEDGRFEGELSSNTFPTCGYVLVLRSLGLNVDDDLVAWFEKNQNEAGYWGLDPTGGSDRNATLFAKLALMEIGKPELTGQMLSRIPDIELKLWILKLLYARSGHISWDSLKPPSIVSSVMGFISHAKPMIPKFILSRVKPPTRYAPPVDFFYSKEFSEMFVAERYTLTPLFLMMELNNNRRDKVIRDITDSLLGSVWSDGSWFRVGFITELSVLALIDVEGYGYRQDEVREAIKRGAEWLHKLRTRDGGCKEALNLNVWDTALSVICLAMVDKDQYRPNIDRAVKWLMDSQNSDGGWPFSSMPGGFILSDADDTSLAIYAMLLADVSREHELIRAGVEWLLSHQSPDGGWGTYRPGVGDVNCVSVTAHAILALSKIGLNVDKAVKWLVNVSSEDGYWSDLWLAKKTYGTACAVDALVRSGNGNLPEVSRAIRWLESMQNPDGGWGETLTGERTSSKVEQTAWSVYAIMHAGRRRSVVDGIRYLLSEQKPDGSWEASCVGIYWEVLGGYADSIYPQVFSLMALDRYRKLYHS